MIATILHGPTIETIVLNPIIEMSLIEMSLIATMSETNHATRIIEASLVAMKADKTIDRERKPGKISPVTIKGTPETDAECSNWGKACLIETEI